MSRLVSFVWASPNCEQWEASEKFTIKYMPPPGIKPATPRFPAWRL